jgi:hypothetical protein
MRAWSPFGYAQGRLLDFVRLAPHFAQDDSTVFSCRRFPGRSKLSKSVPASNSS